MPLNERWSNEFNASLSFYHGFRQSKIGIFTIVIRDDLKL